MRRLAFIAAALALAACTVPEDEAALAVEAYGLTDVEFGGADPLACSDQDTFSRSFEAVTVQGRRVRGVVCSGAFKGATVRITGRG